MEKRVLNNLERKDVRKLEQGREIPGVVDEVDVPEPNREATGEEATWKEDDNDDHCHEDSLLPRQRSSEMPSALKQHWEC